MPRRLTRGGAGVVFHVMNRATRGELLFRDFGEYLAFLRLLSSALEAVPIRLLAFCLMPNHWHLVVWPRSDEELTAFVYLLSKTHAQRLHRWRGTERTGAVYQGRFKAVPVQTEVYFYTVVRYVERNPVRAGLVERAEDWLWSSASPTAAIQSITLADWPLPKPVDWLSYVNDFEEPVDVDLIRVRTARGQAIRRESLDMEAAATPATEEVAAIREP